MNVWFKGDHWRRRKRRMSLIPSSPGERDALRLRLRRRRREVPAPVAAAAARRCAAALTSSPEFLGAKRIAAYVAVRGELDPALVMSAAEAAGKSLFLPCVDAHGALEFHGWNERTPMRSNRFGIPEPLERTQPSDPRTLDLVLVPLLAFDAAGTRLGSGAGYYDRTFAYKRGNPEARPKLAGFGYAFQECNRLAAAAWDVPLDLVATEAGVRRFARRARQEP